MFTEYGADTVAGMHAIDDQMFTEEYQLNYYKANHKIVDRYPQFIGEQTWNFADFETSNGIIRVQGNKKGIFTRIVNLKLLHIILKNVGIISLISTINHR